MLRERAVLCGSVNLPSSEDVFRAVTSAAGDVMIRDGVQPEEIELGSLGYATPEDIAALLRLHAQAGRELEGMPACEVRLCNGHERRRLRC